MFILFINLYLDTTQKYQVVTILDRGEGIFTLSAIYCVKYPESGHDVGVMGYQNSSWDICDLTKKVTGPKIFRARSRGLQSWSAGKFEHLEIWIF